MLKLLEPNRASHFREFFRKAGYSEQNLREELRLTELPSARLRNQAALLDRTSAPTCLNTLLRWFWIGTSVPTAAASVPSWFTDTALECGLLQESAANLVPTAMLVPTDEFLVASDHTSGIETVDPNFVLWPNPTSRLLSRFTVRRPSRATLDLGTGNGILALAAAAYSQTVVATDLNPRAIEFAVFNARLNGIENIEFLTGDAFAPVANRKFDLIVTNPPFFITPAHRYLFCDNPLPLDELCRELIRRAPTHLNEDSYFQMLCEWAQVRGQSWEKRVAGWFENTGCDAWVMKGHTQDPSDYAQERIRETNTALDLDAKLYSTYMQYYRENKVEAIHDGIIVMRRRSGKNWVLIEEVPQTPREPFGDAVLQIFAARDFLESHASDEQMQTVKPQLSSHARLEQAFQQADGGWQGGALTLRLAKGFPFSVGVQPLVAEFLAGCDGKHTLAELVDALAGKVNAPPGQVARECLSVVRTLIERGFMSW